jgi:hypothetical protein
MAAQQTAKRPVALRPGRFFVPQSSRSYLQPTVVGTAADVSTVVFG